MVDSYILALIFFGVNIISIIIISIFCTKRFLKHKSVLNSIFVVISTFFLVLFVIFEAYLIQNYLYRINLHEIHYVIHLNSISEENEIIYFPVSINEKLQNLTEIIYGEGKIEIIESEQGLCLKLNFTGMTSVYGELDTREDIENPDLTMVNQTVPNEDPTETYLKNWIEYWFYYKPYNSTYYNCSVSLELFHRTYGRWESYTFEGYLDEGWNTYWARHEVA